MWTEKLFDMQCRCLYANKEEFLKKNIFKGMTENEIILSAQKLGWRYDPRIQKYYRIIGRR